MKSLSDLELIKEYVRTRDNKYFNILYEKYKNLVTYQIDRYSFSSDLHLKQDLSQNVWLAVLKYLPTFNRDAFLPWLCIICKNKCTDAQRLKKRKPVIYTDYFCSSIESHDYSLSDIKHEQEILSEVVKYSDSLNPTQSITVKLRLEGKSYNEINQMTGIAIGTCQPAYKTAVKKIKKYIEEIYER